MYQLSRRCRERHFHAHRISLGRRSLSGRWKPGPLAYAAKREEPLTSAQIERVTNVIFLGILGLTSRLTGCRFVCKINTTREFICDRLRRALFMRAYEARQSTAPLF